MQNNQSFEMRGNRNSHIFAENLWNLRHSQERDHELIADKECRRRAGEGVPGRAHAGEAAIGNVPGGGRVREGVPETC